VQILREDGSGTIAATMTANNAKSWALSEDEVLARVSSYSETQVTEDLLEFGRVLIEANRDRTKQLEGKAALIVGYCLAALAFLASREPSVIVGWPSMLLRAAGVFAGISLGLAFLALRVSSYPWLSDSQWFENENDVLEDTDRLKRCHVLALHAANKQLNASNDKKADWIVRGQASLILMGISLAVWMLVR
jgi:hypothetical protein